jgi:hypothetical protein
MADWWDLAQTGAEYWLKDKQTGDIESDVVGGYDKARKDIKKYADPYQETAKWGMEGYKQEGPFDFTYEGYLSSPEFQWMQDQTRQATERGAAAGQQGLYSGQTLADVQDRLYNVNAQAYGAEHARQLAAQQARENYWWKPAQTGATLAGDTGKALANIGIERGEARGFFESQEATNLNKFLKSALPGEQDPGMVGDAVKQLFEEMGGEGGTGQNIVDFAKDLADFDLLGELGDFGGYVGDLASGAVTGLLGANTGLSAWGPGSQAAQLAAQTAEFGLEGTAMTVEALESVMGGVEGAAQASGLATDAMNFIGSPAGMGITAAAMTLIMGGDVKDAAVNGGASYLGAALGSAILPGIGTVIGGALGGMVASFAFGDKVAKADSVMMLSQDDTGFKKDLSAEGAFGYIGFKGSATRHLDEKQLKKAYLPAFQTLAKMDNIVAGALSEEEIAAVKDYGKRYTYRKESNEGKISPNKVMRNTIRDRMKMLKKALGEERYNELQLGDMYSAMLSQLKKKGK